MVLDSQALSVNHAVLVLKIRSCLIGAYIPFSHQGKTTQPPLGRYRLQNKGTSHYLGTMSTFVLGTPYNSGRLWFMEHLYQEWTYLCPFRCLAHLSDRRCLKDSTMRGPIEGYYGLS